MKISVSPSFLKIDDKIPLKSNVTAPLAKEYPQIKSLSSIPFYGLVTPHSEKFYAASNYIKEAQDNLFKVFDKTKALSLNDLNLNKLDGIQEGIDVYKGLSMKEIAFVFNKPHYLVMSRACNNGCENCFAGAPALVSKKSNLLSKASKEDFDKFIDGTCELEKRLGMKLLDKTGESISFVYDSDNILVEIFDKNGKSYDVTYLIESLYKKTGARSLVDTAGWVPSDKKMQNRAEKIVAYLSENDNYAKAQQINISVNPFHDSMNLSRKYEEMGNTEKALEKRNLYTDRMANAIVTFSPLIDCPNFNISLNALEQGAFHKNGYGTVDLHKLNSEILEKVKQKFVEDMNGKQKFVKSAGLIDYYMKRLDSKFEAVRISSPLGKGKSFYPQSVSESIEASEKKALSNLVYENSKDVEFINLIDVNGKCYYTNNNILIPSETTLNYSNKEASSVPFYSVSDTKITKKIIERDF